ncbi:hypothetical protein IEQ34_006210 [Dendrobium chrysotoxum]|uniref:Uncharacterized protein n=1 Tax=Dendrobium chrysotoxum TaxID=161865 RepID=A0AAV7HB53_DENCH|nr:hypothetical protein IEQ34_006210 [Dendrobium chrysotoxum]
MEERDPWLTVDKLEHLIACFFISVLVATLARRSRHSFICRRSVALGSVTALAAGAAKEASDEISLWKSAGGSVRDAAADALGVALAAALLALADSLKPSGQRRRSSDPDQQDLFVV